MNTRHLTFVYPPFYFNLDLDQYSQMTGADYPEVDENEIIKKLDEAEEGDTMSLLDQEMDDLEYEEEEEEIIDDGEEIVGEIDGI